MSTTTQINPEFVLSKDLRNAASTLTQAEARYLVDYYYMMQEIRKSADNQVLALSKSEEPHALITWLSNNSYKLETQIKRALDVYSDSSKVGEWSKSIVGIGPVISAGLLAHIDITKAPVVSHIWRFAGLDPTVTWNKGEKRPWNADLKVLCWKIGESFVKVCNRDDAFYGKIYLDRKKIEDENNQLGLFADQAKAMLTKKNFSRDTKAKEFYTAGKLPPAHIHRRAQRYAVKIFLSHWHHVAYEVHFGQKPPKPFAIAHLGHAHYLKVPNWPDKNHGNG